MSNFEVKQKLSIMNKRKRKPMSDNHKAKISNKLMGKMPKNTSCYNQYKNIQSGRYKIGNKNIFFRSKWEANYSLYLEFLIKYNKIKSWKYEVDVFVFENIKFGTRSYRPDFKVINTNNSIEYHEVKGYWDKKSITKMKRMKKYYPDIKIIIIDSERYKEIGKFSKLYGWY